MKRSDLLACAGVPTERFKAWNTRGHIPFQAPRAAFEGHLDWRDYSLDDAFRLRMLFTLAGEDSGGMANLGGVRPIDGKRIVSEAMGRFPRHPLLQIEPEDWWLGIAVFETSDSFGEPALDPQIFCGAFSRLSDWASRAEATQERRLARLHVVNVTRAAEFVQDRAEELGHWTPENLLALEDGGARA